MKRKLTLSILIPVYNEEKTISVVINRILAFKYPNLNKELIIVNDGSFDKTVKSLRKFSNKRNIKIYHHKINSGKGSSIRTCIQYATGDLMIIQDGDMELDPLDYKYILKPMIEENKKVVYGSRFMNSYRKVPYITFIGNKILTKTTNILYGSKLTDMATAYKAFDKKIIKSIKIECNRFEVDAEITAKILKKSINIHEVPIKYFPRSKKEGKKIKLSDAFSIIYTLIILKIFSSLNFLGNYNKVISPTKRSN